METLELQNLLNLLNSKNSSSDIMENLHKFLLDAIESKNFQCFKQIVEENLEKQPTIVKYVDPDTRDTYLDKTSREGLTEFVKFLLCIEGAEINRVNEMHNCAPIHFATMGGHVDTLTVLLTQHTIDVDLEVEQRTALHIALENNDLKCAVLLLEKGASVNILDNENRTALHLAAIKNQHGIVKMILDKYTQCLEVDRYKDCDNQTTREVIERKFPELKKELSEKLPFKDKNSKINTQDLKYHLNNKDEANFLKCIELFQEEISPNIIENLLTKSMQYNFQQAVIAILNKFKGKHFNVKKVICETVQNGHLTILKELLKVKPQMINDLLLSVCQELEISPERENDNLLKCLKLILEQDNADVRCTDISDAKMDLEVNSEQDCLLSKFPTNTDIVFHKLLSNALQSKDFCSFEKAIIYKKQSTNTLNIDYIDSNTQETYLDTASKNGLTKFVEFLLRQGAKPNRVNELQKRAPIHFATEGGHVDTLAVLLAEPTINLNLEADRQTALHIAVRRNHQTCADLLLKKHASVNIPNSKGLTALHLAAINGQRDMVKLILEKNRILTLDLDIDTYKDWGKRTARDVIQNKMSDLLKLCPPKNENREVNAHVLKYYLDANDEKNFLESMKRVKIEVLHDSEVEELLEMAVQRNFYRSVIKILEKFKGRQFSIQKAAEAAVLHSHSAILQKLLCEEPKMANNLVLSACQQLGIPEKQKVNDTSHRLECLKLILEQDVDVHCTDNRGNTPLHYAAMADCAEAITLLLNRGSYIGHMNKFDIPPIEDVPACMLSRYFDDCLRMTKEWGEYKIEFDYRCLMPHNILKRHDETRQPTCEMEVFKYIASNNNLKHLLKHPILSSFLYLKWHKIRHIMWVKLFFYLGFFSVLNLLLLYYVFSMSNSSNKNSTYIANNSYNMTLEKPLQIVYQNNRSLNAIILSLLVPFTLWKILQCCFCRLHYLVTFENFLQFIIIVLTVALTVNANFEIGIVLILLSAWEVIILISQFGVDTSTSFEMFQKISVNYMRLFCPYIIIISEFALIFYILFKNNKNFSDFERSFFKTVIVLIGEFEASNIILHSIFSHIIFTLYVFFIAIVLFNLLNGLAVNNTAEILGEVEVTRLISKIYTIAFIEDIAVGKVFKCYFCCRNSELSRWHLFSFLARSIFLFPHYLRSGKLNVKLSDNANNYCCNGYRKIVTKYCNTCNESVNCDKYWIAQRMDSNIIKQVKQIVLNKNQLSDNEKIIMEITKLREQMTAIEATLKHGFKAQN
ncbi:transient receptor potential cation channel protein painless-like isoform X1 [Monomorium pharaonis]|uniref:transient receptor potential cation channel protein painless-like isoform X1 n=1 Tax=Monomorium pharaonis TaxID=307658 RepID=UPI0017479ED8|nr:transient receptor potential cation channel protein painless-like isoform X1 [Monomorium pharaonis]